MLKRMLLIFIGVIQCMLYSPSLMADGVVWTFPEYISSTGVNASDPCVGLDINGNAVAAWIENGYLISSVMPVNGDWSTSVLISGPGVSSPQLVVDASGNATAIWMQNGIVSTASQPLNGKWSSVTSLSPSGSSAPQIAVDATGNVVAVWVTSGVIESATRLFGGAWQATPDMLSSSGMDLPQVAIGANGNVVAVWHNTVSSPSAVFAANKPISGTWSAAQTISSASYNSAYPKIAVDSHGNAAAIWFRYMVSNNNFSNVVLQAALRPYNGSWAAPADLSGGGYYDPADLVSKVQYDPPAKRLPFGTPPWTGPLFMISWRFYPPAGNG